jgi:hypothetical protein
MNLIKDAASNYDHMESKFKLLQRSTVTPPYPLVTIAPLAMQGTAP